MVKTMADKLIIFAMANPDPEITPEEVAAIHDDAIMATGRWIIQIRSIMFWAFHIFSVALWMCAPPPLMMR